MRATVVTKPGEVPSFQDLEFEPQGLPGGVQATLLMTNGYGVSVIGGADGLYGDGKNTFEVAVVHATDGSSLEICYTTPLTNDVLGWQTVEQVEETLEALAGMAADVSCTHSHN